ncbi:hypothetical protein ACWD4T_51030 [Streptomyces umbrinus]
MNGSLHEATNSDDTSDVILRALSVLAHNGLDGAARTRLAGRNRPGWPGWGHGPG